MTENMSVWVTKSDHDIFLRHKFAIAVYENRYVLVAGGYDNMCGGIHRSVFMIDTETNLIRALPDLPETNSKIKECCGAIIEGYFYVTGSDSFFQRMNLSTTIWEKDLSSKFDVKADRSIISLRGHLCIIGDGDRSSCTQNENFIFDPITENLTEIPNMSKLRSRYSIASIGNNIYVIGGQDENDEQTSLVETFHVPSRTWSQAPNLPIALSDATATAFDERWIVVTGGLDQERNAVSFCFLFDTYNQRWMQSPCRLQTPLYGHRSAVVGSKLIIVGGERMHDLEKDSIQTIEVEHLIPNWYKVNHLILLRKLMDDGRAYFRNQKNQNMKDMDAAIRKLMTFDNLDTFRTVLLFLISTK